MLPSSGRPMPPTAPIGRTAAAFVDAGFLVVFAVRVAREVVAGKNWRNLKVAAVVLALAVANVAFRVEDARAGLAEFSIRAALSLIVMLILLVGGRVIPSFTGNWIARMGAGARPVPFGRPDGVVLTLSGIALLAWVAEPEGVVTGVLALAAGAANLWRLSRWRGFAARRDALLRWCCTRVSCLPPSVVVRRGLYSVERRPDVPEEMRQS